MNFLPFPFNIAAGFIGKNWKWFAIGLAVLALVLFVKGHFDGDAKVKRDLAAMTKSRDSFRDGYNRWHRYGLDEKRAFDDSERYRRAEHGQSVDSLNAAAKTCAARVTEARRSAQAIKDLLDAPPKLDPAGKPSRLLDHDGLSDALGLGKPARAPGG